MNIVLFDTARSRKQLYPLSLTKPISDIRFGIFSLREWFEELGVPSVSSLTENYLGKNVPKNGPWICIDATIVPEIRLFESLKPLSPGAMLEDENGIVAYLSESEPVYDNFPLFFHSSTQVATYGRITHPMDLVKRNAGKICSDAQLLKVDDVTVQLKTNNQVFGRHPIYMEKGARMSACNINTEEGPVHIGVDALVMEGALLRGPLSIGKSAVMKMGAIIYPGTTIGKNAVAGGEIKNSILGDHSNKAHHGYLGDSIIGEWCNLGAGTTNSNVKNNAGIIKMWCEEKKDNIPIGNKAGFVMGDYCKTAINTALNSGTTIGVASTFHQPGFQAKRVFSFDWGPGEKYIFGNLLEDLKNWFAFKGFDFSENHRQIIEYLYHLRKEV